MTNSTHTPPPGPEQDTPGADRFTQRLGESAHQVWLAGLGAFNRAQVEGSRFFDSLVRDGEAYEQRSKAETGGAAGMHDSIAASLGQARERTARTWDKVEQAFDEQVQGVLRRLNVPAAADVSHLQEEINALRLKIAQLEARLHAQQAAHKPTEN